MPILTTYIEEDETPVIHRFSCHAVVNVTRMMDPASCPASVKVINGHAEPMFIDVVPIDLR